MSLLSKFLDNAEAGNWAPFLAYLESPGVDVNLLNTTFIEVMDWDSPPNQPTEFSADEFVSSTYRIVLEGHFDNFTASNRLNAIMLAARFNHVIALNKLIQLGINIEAQNPQGHTALYFASYNDSLETTKQLLIHGAKADDPFIIMDTIECSRDQEIFELVLKNGGVIQQNYQLMYNNTRPLLHAGYRGNVKAVGTMLKLLKNSGTLQAELSMNIYLTSVNEAVPCKYEPPNILGRILHKLDEVMEWNYPDNPNWVPTLCENIRKVIRLLVAAGAPLPTLAPAPPMISTSLVEPKVGGSEMTLQLAALAQKILFIQTYFHKFSFKNFQEQEQSAQNDNKDPQAQEQSIQNEKGILPKPIRSILLYYFLKVQPHTTPGTKNLSTFVTENSIILD